MNDTKQVDLQHYIGRMKDAQRLSDAEEAHVIADQILCRVLREIGMDELVKEWEKVDKWYA